MRSPRTFGLLLLAASTLLPEASGADPHGRTGHGRSRWDGLERESTLHGYAMLKGGGMMLGSGSGSTGGYLGLELGQSAARRLDLGFSVDWYHRHSREVELLFETDHGFDPPLRGEVTRFESSADFVPLGVTLRLRIPVRGEALVPFISTTLAYEVLHVDFFAPNAVPGPYDAMLGRSQTLMGFGWQAAAGVQIALAPTVGLFGEAGMHRSDPSRQLEFDRSPVDVHASLHGGFLRAGFRVDL